ncbi:hypothetical protein KCP70_00555 [Salmonella enterica subsp. enterica]|nr:hypothetical protein KCP70_00555 [Salmonella enterica subsp. enterica]
MSVNGGLSVTTKTFHGKTGYQEVEVDNHGRIVRLLAEDVPPSRAEHSPDAGSPFTKH